jgi:hypothetical protein
MMKRSSSALPTLQARCVRVIYLGYRVPLVMTQNSRYDQFPPAAND